MAGATIVPDTLVAVLQAGEVPDGLQQAPPAPGDRVVVIEGELAGIEGIFVTDDGERRATILLDIVGRATRVRLPIAWVEVSRDG